MKPIIALLLVSAFFIAGCSAQSTPVPPSSPSETPKPEKVSSPTKTRYPTWTPVVIPTRTIKPIATQQPTKIPTATVPVATYIIQATLDAANELCPSDISPKGEWLALVCDGYTKFFRLGGNTLWDVPFYENFGVQYGVSDGNLQIFHWSKDGRFVYLVPYFCCADSPQDAFFNYFNKGSALYRLDLQTGRVTITLRPNSIWAGYAIKFSPNDKYLAYIDGEGYGELSIYTLQTGETHQVTFDGFFGGAFDWSPDSKKVAIVAAKTWCRPGSCDSSEDYQYSYYLIDTRDWSSSRLFNNQQGYYPTWEDNDSIIFKPLFDEGDDLLYRLGDKSITAITPTPKP